MEKIVKEKISSSGIIKDRINFGEGRLKEGVDNSEKYESLIRARIKEGLKKPISPAYIKEQQQNFRARVDEIIVHYIGNHAASEDLSSSVKETVLERDKAERKEKVDQASASA